MPTEQLHYGPTAKVFHWVIAALIAIQLPLGWLMPDIHRGQTPGLAMTVHVSIGMTILLLIVPRLLWRLTHPVAPESNLPPWQRVSSELVHWLLYLVVLLATLSGWFAASAKAGRSICSARCHCRVWLNGARRLAAASATGT